MTIKLALLGDPVKHSLSPRIHTAFAKQFSLDLEYQKILTPKGDVAKTFDWFFKQGGFGGNITVPIKKEAYELCQHLSPQAKKAKAVNTFWQQDEKLYGDNTDGVGFINYTHKHLEETPKGKKILLLGAGGAASALVAAFCDMDVASMLIVNRQVEKAEDLAKLHNSFSGCSYEELDQTTHPNFDWVINATSCSLQNKLPKIGPQWIEGTLAIDLAYLGGEDTAFIQWAKRNVAKKVDDGLGMLVEQAALSFNQWFKKHPETFSILSNLRSRE